MTSGFDPVITWQTTQRSWLTAANDVHAGLTSCPDVPAHRLRPGVPGEVCGQVADKPPSVHATGLLRDPSVRAP